MKSKTGSTWIIQSLRVAAITIAVVAVYKELGKPKPERTGCGVVGFVPYDFRMPGLRKLMQTFWNPYDPRVFTQPFFGVGWGINFYALLEKLRIIAQGDFSEERFLMPTRSIKELLTQPPSTK